MTIKNKVFYNNFHLAIYWLLSFSVAFLPIYLVLRLYEIFVVSNIYNFPVGSWKFELLGICFDILAFIKLTAIITIPYLIIFAIKPKAGKIFYIVMSVLLLIISLSLLQYFGNAKVPLGADLFGYSKDEIQQTVGSSGAFKIMTFVPFIVFIAATIYLLLKVDIILFPKFIIRFFYGLLIIALLYPTFVNPKEEKFSNEFDYFIASNKLGYFINSTFEHFASVKKMNKEHDAFDIDNEQVQDVDTYQKKSVAEKSVAEKTVEVSKNSSTGGNKVEVTENKITKSHTYAFEYVSSEYPFLHKDNSEDVLGRFFKVGKEKPNFVFIIVESLGSAYSGDLAYRGSFTPFLDSLMKKSLYFENCLSTSGRTFSVLPSLMASTPFGESGFAEMGVNMPQHQSLLRLLKSKGYTSSFYYGGDAHFDNMDIFLKRQLIDRIVDEKVMGKDYKRLPAAASGFTWGYGEKEIFRRYLNDMNVAGNNKSGRVDIFLTIAMHSPFIVTDQELYNKKFDERLNALDMPQDKKDYDKQYKAQLATVLYFDDALRNFITEFSKHKEFKNTIFIITGDHRMPEIPISTQLDRFHVPLVIYSPMIIKPQKFSSVSTHFDVLPSLLAFLRENYRMKFPYYVSWIGHGLDVEPSFRNIHSYPLMRNKGEFVDYIDKLDFLSKTTLYRVYRTLDIEPENNDNNQSIGNKFEDFKTKNNFVCKKNRLLPDSLMK